MRREILIKNQRLTAWLLPKRKGLVLSIMSYTYKSGQCLIQITLDPLSLLSHIAAATNHRAGTLKC